MKYFGQKIVYIGLILFVLMLSSLILMSNALQGSSYFGQLYLGLLIFNALGLLTFITLIVLNFRRLARQLRNHTPGAKMTVRIVTMFTLLSVVPVLVVYYFSLDFLIRGIDNWFDLRVEQALDDSLKISKLSLDVRMRELLKTTEQIADEFSRIAGSTVPFSFEIDDLRARTGAKELTLLSKQGGIIFSSSDDPLHMVPDRPNETILLQLQQGRSYTGLDSIRDSGLHIRVVVNIPDIGIGEKDRIIQALYPVTDNINTLAENVQDSYVKYKELSYLREQLKISFVIVLTLVLLFSIFSAVWAAFYSARRLAEPVRDLAEGTRAVADGDYETQLKVPGNDELGFLVASFNEMTRKISQARDEASRSQYEAETQRAYLETVLGKLSSGVLVLDQDKILRTSNNSADQILYVPMTDMIGQSLEQISNKFRHLEEFNKRIDNHLDNIDEDWREQLTLNWQNSQRIMMCSGTSLAGTDYQQNSHVIVFDDITELVQGQRNAAWSEMAQRLAHEIKNPLTPIQLATERIRHKYLHTMKQAEAETFDRLTNTIVQQVETMKDMVNAFTDFARPSELNTQEIDLNKLIKEVLDLYSNLNPEVKIKTVLDVNIPLVSADPGRIRQVLNNLVKNSFDACDRVSGATLKISTKTINLKDQEGVEIRIDDSGHGIDQDILENIFEPYVTTKTKGTGLGLAIVRKIIEEHGGVVWLENNKSGNGASAIINIPVNVKDTNENVSQRREII